MIGEAVVGKISTRKRKGTGERGGGVEKKMGVVIAPLLSKCH